MQKGYLAKVVLVGVIQVTMLHYICVHAVGRICLSGNVVLAAPPLANRSSHSSTSRLVRPVIACVTGVHASGRCPGSGEGAK